MKIAIEKLPDMQPSNKTLAVYKSRIPQMKRSVRYEFYIFGAKEAVPERQPYGNKFAMEIPYPQAFHCQQPDLLGYVGYINYSFFGANTAVTYDYRPKGNPRRGNIAYNVRQLGYLNEFLACYDLSCN
jgi:hypothetical protein